MDGDASLAQVIRDYGDEWELERVPRGTEWIAVSRDRSVRHIVGARDLTGLRSQIQAAEQQGDTGAARRQT